MAVRSKKHGWSHSMFWYKTEQAADGAIAHYVDIGVPVEGLRKQQLWSSKCEEREGVC